jgi:hypothetical protein
VEALISDFGGDAYAEACQRAGEASNDSLARDWSVCRRDDRSQVGLALILARRLIRLNGRILIRGYGAA